MPPESFLNLCFGGKEERGLREEVMDPLRSYRRDGLSPPEKHTGSQNAAGILGYLLALLCPD